MIRFFPILILLSLPAHAEDLSQSLVLLKEDSSKGFEHLERVFAETKKKSKKARIAQILSFANSSFLKVSPIVYARYALKEGKGIPNRERVRLHRMLGDEAFKNSEFETAEKHFKAMIQMGVELRDKEYGTYKLGWIYLNQSKPRKTWNIWSRWLNGTDGGEMRALIARDCARAWGEAVYSGKQPEPSFNLKNIEKFQEEIYEGLELARNRYKKRGILPLIRSLRSSPKYTLIFNVFLRESSRFSRTPCHITAWSRGLKLGEIDREKATPVLSACARLIDQKRAKLSKSGTQNFQMLYAGLELRGMDRWPRAHLALKDGKFDSACADFCQAYQEAESSKVSAREKLGEGILASCRNPNNAVLEWMKKVFSFPQDKLNSKWVRRIAGNEKLFQSGFSLLLVHFDQWRATDIPLLYYDQLGSPQEKEKVLALFGAVENPKIDERAFDWVQSAVKRKDPRAQEYLAKFFPLTPQRKLDEVRLWLLFSLSQGGSSYAGIGAVLDLFAVKIQESPAKGKLYKSDKQTLAELWVSMEKWSLILNHWSVLKDIFSNRPEQAQAFFEWARKQKATDVTPKMGEDSWSRYLIAAERVTSISEKPARYSFPKIKGLKKTRIDRNLRFLAQLRSIELQYRSIQFEKNSKFYNRLTGSVKRLKNYFSRSARMKWDDENLLKVADHSLTQSAGSLVSAIEKVPVESPDEKEQLEALASAIRQWRVM